MSRIRGPSSPEVLAVLDRDRPEPLHVQLEQSLRAHIRTGRLATGARLPSTRTLAGDLGVARGVVSEAYAQLGAEGWVIGRRGAGTVVAEHRADQLGRSAPSGAAGSGASPALAFATGPDATQTPTSADRSAVRVDFGFGAPDLSLFPRRRWLAATRAALDRLPDAALGYGDPRGLPELRGEVAAYLRRARAVDADPERMLIASGTVQGLSLVCRALRARGARRIAIEDPGWAAQRTAVERAGLIPVPVSVDDDGIRVDHIPGLDVDAVLVTPAHQFPTGAVLAADRRQLLIEWAAANDAFVVEDDYDAEYRYDRAAPGSLQALAPDRIVYAGSASKTLAPALRLGWLVLPQPLADALTVEKRDADRATSPLTQIAFADLLAHGHLDRHLRRTRLLYRTRRDRLLAALAEHMPAAELTGAAAGLHAVALLPPGADESRIVTAARARGIALTGIAELHVAAEPTRPGLVLGYAAVSEHLIDHGIAELAEIVAAG